MSAAAVTRVVASLWPQLRSILLNLGRWVIERLARRGLARLRYYMEDKIEDFERRVARVSARRRRIKVKRGPRYDVENWRVLWLRSRIKRWKLALKWLSSSRAEKLRGKAIDMAAARAERQIPEQAPGEDFRKWLREKRKAS